MATPRCGRRRSNFAAIYSTGNLPDPTFVSLADAKAELVGEGKKKPEPKKRKSGSKK